MKQPTVRVELVDGTGTWVTIAPITQLDHIGAESAAGAAFAMFVASIARQRRSIDRNLAALADEEAA